MAEEGQYRTAGVSYFRKYRQEVAVSFFYHIEVGRRKIFKIDERMEI